MGKLGAMVLFLVLAGSALVNVGGYSNWHQFHGPVDNVLGASFTIETKPMYSEDTENVRKVIIDDKDIKVEIILNETYHPGDSIRADFYITNKGKTFDSIDIELEVYYLGVKVFSYEHPSWRKYPPGKTVHIFYESKLPIVTPPGKYVLKFYLTPAGREPKEISTSIWVRPNPEWILLSLFFILAAGVVVFLTRRYWGVVANTCRQFSFSRKMVFLAVSTLLVSGVLLAFSAEDYANVVSMVAYYFLLVGALNMWVEYIGLGWDNERARGIISIYLLFVLMYTSKDTLTIYPALITFIVGSYYLFQMLWERWGKGGGAS